MLFRSLLIVCGYEPSEIFQDLYSSPNLFEKSKINLNILTQWGLFSSDIILKKLEEMIFKKIDEEKSPLYGLKTIPTVIELFERTNKNLVTVVSNLTEMKACYINHEDEKFKNFKCTEIVRMACTIPIIFQKIEYDNNYYIDGAFIDNFPIKYVDDGRRKILGLNINCNDFTKIDSFITYFDKFTTLTIKKLTEITNHHLSDECFVITLSYSCSIIDFELTSEKKMTMFLHGYNETKKLFE